MPEYTLIIIRSIFIFFYLLLLARMLGKQQIAQLTFFDYITGITIGNIAADIAINPSSKILDGVIGITIFGIFTILIAYGALKSIKLRKVVSGSPTVLVRNGNVLEKNLFKVRLTADDLMMGLREKNAFKLADVELAMLETNGKFSVMKKTEKAPLTPKDIGLALEPDHKPQLVIIDGQLLEKRLHYLGYTKEWLFGEVMKKGAKNFSDVFLAQIDSKGNVYVDLYDEGGKTPQVKQKPLLAAQLRKIQADLEGYAIQTNDHHAKNMYYAQSKEVQRLIDKIHPYLKG